MKIRKSILLTSAAVWLLLGVVGCNGGGSTATSTGTAAINSVTVGKMNGDTQANQFSTVIKFTNGSQILNSWQLGFYMPRSFKALHTATQNYNPDLMMQICETNNSTNCATLNYSQATAITDNDLSAGYTTVVAPASIFALKPGVGYTVSLMHNNQWNAGNYSAVPQNIFLISGTQVINFPSPDESKYKLLDYDAVAVNTKINQHISDNWTNSATVAPAVNIVPSPVNYTQGGSNYTLENGVAIHNNLSSDNTVANYFKTDLANDLSITASVDNTIGATSGIIIGPMTDEMKAEIGSNPEGYQIIINGSAINIYAINSTGVFYALQSLRQLWNQSSTLDGVTITDYPRFKYRGLLLDTARHFFSVSEVETIIEIAATHKLNTLHIHFADDEGFRIGLSDYPSLAAIADSRGYGENSTIAEMFIQGNLDITNYNNIVYPFVNTTYTGTYSLDDLNAITAYANARGMTIIPEIDLPGHARALIKALPNDFVDPNDYSQFVSVQGYTDDVIPVCTYTSSGGVGSNFTTTINNIISTIAGIFNNQSTLYAVSNEISVSGDEVSSGAWTNDSSCTGEWAALSSLGKSHKFFGMLANNNPTLKVSGWQQYVQSDETTLGTNTVPPSHAGHVWVWSTSDADGRNRAVSLADAGYPVILDYADQNYFDLAYTPDIKEPGYTWAAAFLDTHSALASSLSATQTINSITAPNQAKVEGVEGTLWSENLANYNHLIYMALPKMAGLSEAAWSPTVITTPGEKLDWQSLATRLGCGQSGFLSYLNKLYGVHYRGYPNGISEEVPEGVCP